MCNAYEQDEVRLPLSFSKTRIKLKMPSDGEERPREAYPRLTGKFLRCVAGSDDPASLYELEEIQARFGLVDQMARTLPPDDHRTPAYNNARSETVHNTWPFKPA